MLQPIQLVLQSASLSAAPRACQAHPCLPLCGAHLPAPPSTPLLQEATLLRQHASICDALSSGGAGHAVGAREVAVALLETERLLSQEGGTTEEWQDVWQGPWRK